jgi:hypothetical protein
MWRTALASIYAWATAMRARTAGAAVSLHCRLHACAAGTGLQVVDEIRQALRAHDLNLHQISASVCVVFSALRFIDHRRKVARIIKKTSPENQTTSSKDCTAARAEERHNNEQRNTAPPTTATPRPKLAPTNNT